MSSSSKNVTKREGKIAILSQAFTASACAGCAQPDSVEDMVQCDSCDAWWHYTCAKVDDSVKDQKWECIRCQAGSVGSRCAKSNTSSARERRARVQLELQRLDEEKALVDKMQREKEEQEKVAREEEKVRREKALEDKKAIEEEYVRRKYQLLEETIIDDDRSDKSRSSAQSSRSKVKEWIDRQSLIVKTGSGNTLSPTAISTANSTTVNEAVSTKLVTGAIPKTKVSTINRTCHDGTKSVNENPPLWGQAKTVNWGASVDAIELPCQPQVRSLHHSFMQHAGPAQDNSMCESMPLPMREENQQTYEIPDQMQHNVAPTSRQLSARHVVPKDLPIFTGNPVEWPMFISAYNNSTSMCGFSNGENMMRLQRCLKGNALEAVRCHLLMPESVPIVLSMLKTLYGRPELIIQVLLAKVKSVPAPKADKLESLVNFGLVVQNLCAHLKAAHQKRS